jgi:zinc protease
MARADPPTTAELLRDTRGERFVLPNGLEVVLQADRSTSRASLCMRYRVGMGDDPVGYRGITHLAEHLTYGPTRHIPEGLLAATDALGPSSYNGITSVDSTEYFATVHGSAIDRLLRIESERMAFSLDAITAPLLRREKQVVCTEHADREGESPTGDLAHAVRRELFPVGHRYHEYGDQPEDVRAVSLHGAQWHVQRWYIPACACLAVVGNIDVPRTRAVIERYWGSIPRSPVPRSRAAPPHRLAAPGTIIFDARDRDEVIMWNWLTPALWVDDDAALDLCANILERVILAELGRTTNKVLLVEASQTSRQTLSQFSLEVLPHADVNSVSIRNQVEQILARIARDGVTDLDFRAARARQDLSLLSWASSTETRAALATMHPDGDDIGMLRRNHARYEALDATAVSRAFRRHLDVRRALVVEVHANIHAPAHGRVAARFYQ